MRIDRLKALRKEKRLTQAEFADLMKIARTTYAAYEQGKRQPDYDTLTRLAEFYKVTTDYLIGKDGTPKWATKEDTKDLKEFLEANEGSMTFGGVDLTPEQDAQVRVAMATIFWNEKKKEKK